MLPGTRSDSLDALCRAAGKYRDGRVVVSHLGRDAIHDVNRSHDEVSRLAKNKNSSAVASPPVSSVVSVHDLETRSFHLLFVHRLDLGPRKSPHAGNVVAFSEPAFAAVSTDRIQLATPAYYRDQKALKQGIRDRHDGALTKDATRWADEVVIAGSVSWAELRFVSMHEPWVYCAAHYCHDQQLGRLRKDFATNYGYTAATSITDPAAFATWLGIDFALGFDKTADVQLTPLDEWGYAASRYQTNLWAGSHPIDTFVHVYHGPVRYEDRSGRVDSQEHWYDPHAGPSAWFTKRRSFEAQREYRFAVSTLGEPAAPKHYIAVSPELRGLVSAV